MLIVDDDWLLRNAVAERLEAEGYAVASAPNGAAAARRAGDWRPDVILLDMPAPPLDQSGFVREYRKVAAPRAPMVVMTVREAAARAAQAGLAPVLAKPFDLDDVCAAIERVVSPQALRLAA